MKRIHYFIFMSLLTGIITSSCKDTSYAKELKLEKIMIDDFIKRNGILVLKEFPSNNVWPENAYVLTESGLYFHLTNPGVGDTIKLSYKVVPRYLQYTLTVPSDTVRNWSTNDFAYPSDFIYGDNSLGCPAFQEAVSYMKRNDSQAKIIVPSKIGYQEFWSPATPMGYDILIKFQK